MDDSRILTTMTDEKGRAAGRGLHPNNLVGQYQIRINATYQQRNGTRHDGINWSHQAVAATKAVSKDSMDCFGRRSHPAGGAVQTWEKAALLEVRPHFHLLPRVPSSLQGARASGPH